MTAREMFEALGYEYKHYKQRISYSKTVYRTTTLIVFDLKTKQAYCECGMGIRAFNSEESKAVQQQKKELGWLEEEKQETNYEHFKDEIIENCIENLAVVKGRPKLCYKTNCNDCDFKINQKECHEMAKDWLKHPHEKPVYKLTKFEKELLECYSDVYSFKVFNSLNGMKEKGYFKGIDDNELIGEILAKCEVV